MLFRHEREVLRLIAEVLHLSVNTVQSHPTNLMQKLDLHDRGDVIKYAIQKKIIAL
jgi:two-component system, NarL family, response regulator NreC